MTETKPYVRIQSTVTINVTGGLQNNDVTNPDAHIPDRLKVSPMWPKMTCLIRKGVGVYPSEIVEWNTVKALARDKVITIGEYLDDPESTEMSDKKEELQQAKAMIEKSKQKKGSLADIAGE